jgi:hypothetical protein
MSNDPIRWTLVAAVNNEAVLESTLLRSPDIGPSCQVVLRRGYPSAGAAYNSGLAQASSQLVVLAHQDVYLPKGWKEALDRSIAALGAMNLEWGCLGVFGIAAGAHAGPVGYCYSTGIGQVLGAPFNRPVRAQSLDELVLVVRRSSGLLFDERLPGFHLYGTDISLQASFAGLNCYIVPAFCIHNSNGLKYMPRAYWRCYLYMRHKWWSVLPLTTCCSTISRSLKPLVAQLASDIGHWLRGGAAVGTRSDDVVGLYGDLVATGKIDTHRTEESARERYV